MPGYLLAREARWTRKQMGAPIASRPTCCPRPKGLGHEQLREPAVTPTTRELDTWARRHRPCAPDARRDPIGPHRANTIRSRRPRAPQAPTAGPRTGWKRRLEWG